MLQVPQVVNLDLSAGHTDYQVVFGALGTDYAALCRDDFYPSQRICRVNLDKRLSPGHQNPQVRYVLQVSRLKIELDFHGILLYFLLSMVAHLSWLVL